MCIAFQCCVDCIGDFRSFWFCLIQYYSNKFYKQLFQKKYKFLIIISLNQYHSEQSLKFKGDKRMLPYLRNCHAPLRMKDTEEQTQEPAMESW